MNIWEFQQCAKEYELKNGIGTLEFIIKNPSGGKFKGKFIDAFLGFVQIEGITEQNECVTIKDLEKYGGKDCTYHLIET